MVPKGPSPEDLRAIREAHTLLTGGAVDEVVTSVTMEADDTESIRGLFTAPQPVRLRQNHPAYEIRIFGQNVPVGPVQRTLPPLYASEHRRTADGWHITLTAGTEPGANVASIRRAG